MTEFTGERVIPGEVEADLLNEHLARYAFAARFARERRVLDAGCGAGYGAARLAAGARRVVALDLAAEAIDIARSRYASPRLEFLRADCRALPFASAAFDLVVAFEVVEHLGEWEKFLAEARRVLSGAGELVISTPNRLYYGESRETPNPFHVHEFDYEEFRESLGRHFPRVEIFLENHTESVVIAPFEPGGVETAVESAGADPDAAHFFVAVCSPRAASKRARSSPAFVYVPKSANVLREREQHIGLLESELEQKNQWLEQAKQSLDALHREHQTLEQKAAGERMRAQEIIAGLEQVNASKTEWARRLEAEQEDLKRIIEKLQAELEEQTQWALQLDADRAETLAAYQRLDAEAGKLRSDLAAAVEQLHSTEAELEARTQWAQSLDRHVTQLTADLNAIFGSPAYRLGKRLRLAPVVGSDPRAKDRKKPGH